MSEWKEEVLDNLVFVDPEQLSLSTDEDFTFFYIDISSVSEGHIDYPISQIEYKGSPSRARKTLKINDVLMSTVRPNLKSFAKFNRVSRFNFVASTGFAILRAKKETDIDYIYHSLFSEKVERQIQTLVVGSNYPAINSSDVRKLVFNVPDYPTQRKIALILSTADAVIEKTQAAIAKYKAIKQGMLHDLFTRGIDTQTGKLRPKYEDAPELYKKSKLGWIPKEWEVKIFGEQVELVHGHQYRNYDFTEFGVPVVKIGQVKPENLDLSDCSFVSFDRIEEFKNEIIRNGDVLMALTGATLGKACLVHGLNGIVFQNYRVGRFEPKIKENDLDKTFLYYLLIAGELLNQIFSKVNSGAQGNVGKADFEKATFKKPKFDEQLQIAQRLQSIDNKLQTEQNYLHKLQHIKTGLMADLMSGKKEVNVDEEFLN